MPFDRLVGTVDEWAGRAGRSDVYAQIGPTSLVPRHVAWTHHLTPGEFRERVDEATLVIAHAGMGSILTSLESGTPLLVFPRRARFRETRNDHQVATARWLDEQRKALVAWDEQELVSTLDGLDRLEPPARISPWASPPLLRAIRDFIEDQ